MFTAADRQYDKTAVYRQKGSFTAFRGKAGIKYEY